jgi:FAD synthetase
VKELLKHLWIANLLGINSGERYLLEKFGKENLGEAERKGFLELTPRGGMLTEKGRKMLKVVVCGGVFDILHPGHGFFLEKAKSYGDILAVVVARDSTVKKRKRIPIVPERQRLEMLRYLRPVDVAVLGGESDPLRIIDELTPDIIVLGPDQKHDESELREDLKKRGLDVMIVRVKEYKKSPLNSTRSILQKIIERRYPR